MKTRHHRRAGRIFTVSFITFICLAALVTIGALASGGGIDNSGTLNLTNNAPPTITAASGLSRQQGSTANLQIATVTDDGGAGLVTVTVTSANPSNGVTISNIVNTGGNVTANIVAVHGASNASFTLQASDGTLTATATLNVTVTPDITPPAVQSMVRASANPTSAASVDYTVTFTESVTGVNTGDFAITASGVTGASVTGVTGSGSVYTVTISTGTGEGVVRADLSDNDSIRDAANNPLGGPGNNNGSVAGPFYTVDKVPPSVESITRADANPVLPGSDVRFTVTFTESASAADVDNSDFALTTTGTISGASILGINQDFGRVFTITVNTGTGTGTLRLDVIDDDTIKDPVGKPLGGVGPGNGNYTAGEVYTVNPEGNFTSLVVTKTGDTSDGVCDADCSLREAITAANADLGAETITFAAGVTGTINLLSALPDLSTDITITGPGANLLTVRRSAAVGTPDFRIFRISANLITINISGMTIANGNAADSGDTSGGGLLINSSATVTLNGVAIINNRSALDGGGVRNIGGTLYIINSLVANNIASTDRGGGIQNFANLVVINSTISGNSAAIDGGGINAFGPISLTNTTITNNRADSDANGSGVGGGMKILAFTNTTSLNNTIIAGNFQGAGSTADNFFDSASTDQASSFNNLVGPNSSFLNAGNGNQNNVANPGLGPLSDNGGRTQTHLLLPTSPAINAGNNSKAVDQSNAPLATDQRGTGFARITGATVDIGAVEVSYSISATQGTQQSATINTAFGTQLQATVTESGAPRSGIPVTFTAPATGASGTFAGNTPSATVTTDANGVATAPIFTANGTAGGPYNVIASLGTGQPTATFALTNTQATTTTAVTSSVNPSELGQSVIFNATVSSTVGTPTGTVTFKDGANAIPSCTNVVLVSGQAACTTNSLTAGTHTITADFSGDANFTLSTGTLTGGQVVNIAVNININDVTVTEGNTGTTNAALTVTLSAASNLTVTVDYQTAGGTATTVSDFQPSSGTLTFNPGETSKQISVVVNGDTLNEPGETFFVNLTNPTNATISDNQGLGTISNDDAPGLQFSLSAYTVTEDAGSILITVNRIGDTSQTAEVDFHTSDNFALAACTVTNGNASERCDYLTATGRLKFAAGQVSNTFGVFINNDVHVEGNEVLTLTLSNPSGGILSVPSTATLTITDNDTQVSTQNPIDDNEFFIRQQYLDFLYRGPDGQGLANWMATLGGCPDGGFGLNNPSCDRVHLAKSFYGSDEFGTRGFFVYRFYDAALSRRPTYEEFNFYLQKIGGQNSPAEGEAAKLEFIAEFISKTEFTNRYGANLQAAQAAQFIANLEQFAGVVIPEPARSQMISQMQNSQKTVGETLRAFIEHQVVFDKFFNRGYASMLYFAHLRRDPDPVGFANYLLILDTTGNYRKATFDFIYSPEYRGRFGQP